MTAVAAWAAPDRARGALGVPSLGAAAWLRRASSAPRAPARRAGVLRVSVLDVGQGDSVLVDLPDGSAMLVDGGGIVGSPVDLGRARRLAGAARAAADAARRGGALAPAPGSLRRPRLDAAAPRRGRAVGHGAGRGPGRGRDATRRCSRPRGRAASRSGGPATSAARRARSAARPSRCSRPAPGYAPDAGANDNSLVLRISYGARAALLVGDAEREEERELLGRARRRSPAPICSRSATTAAGPRPRRRSSRPCGPRSRRSRRACATASATRTRSRWRRSRRGGSRSRRTDRGGEIVWETDGDAVAGDAAVRAARSLRAEPAPPRGDALPALDVPRRPARPRSAAASPTRSAASTSRRPSASRSRTRRPTAPA